VPAQSSPFSVVMRHSDILVALAVITIVVMMIIPLPPVILDIFLALNITLSLIIIMVAIYNVEPLQFSVFPSLLLMTTLFRLALNVSSTRLILLEGYAGEVITAFGNFVVGGNAVVGFIVFVILIIIQFIVITKGAERVAEVAARFTLDAMPGKQMSIDADLNAGLIGDTDARERRRKIQREADFYGAMDGASKFVKGDAIAAIIIIMINIVGGFAIGMIDRNMSITQALQNYTLLTVGEGLVNQIPALLISTATGIVVTRAASDANLGHDITTQLLTNYRVFAITGCVLVFLAMVPGLPGIPFLV
jgi:flagellar biosynthesis protein FlhA